MRESSFKVPDLKSGSEHVNEIIIKRSRFITTLGHTRGMEECKDFIARVSSRYSDANHNCFAFNGDKPGSTAVCGCSDDGEPHGTAGQPMLNVVLHCGAGELTAVVTRYFGGILLGTGGLVKAYQDSVKEALATLPVCERVIPAFLKLSFEHRHVTVFMRLLNELKGEVVNSAFDEKAHYEVMLPEGAVTAFTGRFTETVRGQLTLERVRK